MASIESKPTSISISDDECFSYFGGEYRPYQKKSISEILESLGVGLIRAHTSTGTGKTIVFLSIAIAAANMGYRVAVLVATNQIIDQV